MTEWEQLKKEYREIPVPTEGPSQLLQTIAKAKRKRNRLKNFARYGTVAAAVLLVLLIPGRMLFSGGFGTVAENDSMKMDCSIQSPATGNWVTEESAEEKYSVSKGTPAPQAVADSTANFGNNMEECREAISREILFQMQERMRIEGETYYYKSAEYPEGFEQINEEQEYYINEEGLLVVVFEAGTVAPEKYGKVEFVIPAGVFQP